MSVPFSHKSTIEEIRSRFDQDVERFSQLSTGQQATMDAPLALDLVAALARTHLRAGAKVLDLGCGAGNFTLRVLQEVHPLECHLADLSLPMLRRAEERLRAAGQDAVFPYQSDLRELSFAEHSFDCILAGAVLHHLRDEEDWLATFRQLHRWLAPGGRLYVWDMVFFEDPGVQAVMWERYGAYLESLGGPDYREQVFAYIEKEDSPRSLPFQVGLLQRCGFASYEVLHRNSVFACYCGGKSPS